MREEGGSSGGGELIGTYWELADILQHTSHTPALLSDILFTRRRSLEPTGSW